MHITSPFDTCCYLPLSLPGGVVLAPAGDRLHLHSYGGIHAGKLATFRRQGKIRHSTHTHHDDLLGR